MRDQSLIQNHFVKVILLGVLWCSAHISCLAVDLTDLNQMRVFDDKAKLLETFAKEKVLVKTNEFVVSGKRFLFVSAYPYSGADTIDLYCYESHGGSLRLVAFSFVYEPSQRTLTFNLEGRKIVVLDGKTEVLTIHARGEVPNKSGSSP